MGGARKGEAGRKEGRKGVSKGGGQKGSLKEGS